MICLETVAKIRRYYFVEKKSIREIARILHLARNTIRRVVRDDDPSTVYVRKGQSSPQLDPFKELLNRLLEEDEAKPESKRRHGVALCEALKVAGYRGAHDSIHRYVKGWRLERKSRVDDVFIPMVYAPGEAYQFDWSQESVQIGGAEQKIKLAHLRLAHSRMFFLSAYPKETQEMLFEAHNRAFAFFGGVTRRGIYDNMKTAVDAIHGRDRKFNARFLQMCDHYLIEPVACTPASGWEKGQVENQVAFVRGRLFKPTPSFHNFDELNTWLAAQSIELAKGRKHPEGGDRTVWEVFQAERDALLPLASPFPAYREHEVHISTMALARFETNQYSVECRAAGKLGTLRVFADHIEVWADGECVGEHRRILARDQIAYNPWHYVPVLLTKPGALRNGAPFVNWALPKGLARVRSALERRPDGDRQFVSILHAVMLYGLDCVELACDQAIVDGTVSSDVILNHVSRLISPPKPPTISIPDALQLKIQPLSDCDRYNNLLRSPKWKPPHSS